MKTTYAQAAIVALLLSSSAPALANPVGVAKVTPETAHHLSPATRTTVSNPWYHGGYLIGSPEIHAIFWGPSVRFVPELSQFYADVGNSTFFDFLKEYDIAGYKFGRSGMPSGYVWDEAPSSNYFTDADIETALSNLLDAGIISTTPNALFMVHFPPGVTIQMGGNNSCEVWCAYHGRYIWNSTIIRYGVIPDHSGGCEYGCGGGSATPDAFSRTCVSTSHEVIESMTNPDGTAWIDDEGYEISDICNGQPVQLGKWWVQKQWSNAQNACIDF